MPRNTREQAIILFSRLIGEDNRLITMINDQRGVFEGVLYGGRKSKLCSMISPWHSGTVWLYSQQNNQNPKITDFDPTIFRPSLRENLYKNIAASLVTEIVIKTQAAGENQQAFFLLKGFLDGMEISSEEGCRKGLLRFLWRYLGLLGERPDSFYCSCCSQPLKKNQEFFIYSPQDNGFLCQGCSLGITSPFLLSSEALEYISMAAIESGARARTMELSPESYDQLRNFIFYLITNSVNTKIKTFEAGIGIL